MTKWILKAVIQKTISFLPGGHSINYLFQKYITKGVQLTDAHFEDKLGHARDHIQYFRKYHTQHEGFTALELGSGWYPVVPVALFLCGAGSITTVDISNLMRYENIVTTIRKYKEYNNAGKLSNWLPHMLRERVEQLFAVLENTPSERNILLQKLSIKYQVADARKLDIPAASFDLIVSNNVFEHIYPEILNDILKEFKRLAKPDGISSHFIDMSDHFAHMDKSITIYNFLKFSDAGWRRIDNSIQPQSRLRINHYRDMYRLLGMNVLEQIDRPGNIDELLSVKLDKRFTNINPSIAAVSHSLVISRQ
jgi:SAM-dependent methyltransferase